MVRLRPKGRSVIAAQVAAELYGGRARRDPDVARDLLHLTSAGPGPGLYYQLLSGLAWTSLPQLPRLQAPTLILAGDDDPIIPLVNARIMHRLIPNSALHVYSGGHLELADLEAIHTFEGTETLQTLIVGRAITGIGAFT